jgi:hypothetical protein
VTVRLGTETRQAVARVIGVPEEDALARRLLLEKYRPRYSGELEEWGRTSLPVAIEWERGRRV